MTEVNNNDGADSTRTPPSNINKRDMPSLKRSRPLLCMMLLAMAVAVALPVIHARIIHPGYTRILVSTMSDRAQRLAAHVIPPAMKHTSFSHELLDSPKFLADIYRLEQDLGLLKIKVFAADGEVLYSTDPDDMQPISSNKHQERKLTSSPCAHIFSEMGKSQQGQMVQLDIVRTCVPIMRRNQILGSFEMYFDVTSSKKQLDRFNSIATYGSLIACAILIGVILVLLWMESARIKAQEQTEALKADVDQITRHDIKSPLIGALNGIQYLISYTELTDEQSDMLKDMRTSVHSGLDMINRSLDIYKMESGTYEFVPQPVDIAAVVRRVSGDLSGMASLGGTAISITENGEPPTGDAHFMISAEETLCYSLFANLVKNAIEASDQGHPVTIDLSEDHNAVITIHNSQAVPDDIRDTFFYKYTTSGKKGGTGLGTYSAGLMARTMNGMISLRSSEEEGTTITVTLPMHRETEEE